MTCCLEVEKMQTLLKKQNIFTPWLVLLFSTEFQQLTALWNFSKSSCTLPKS